MGAPGKTCELCSRPMACLFWVDLQVRGVGVGRGGVGRSLREQRRFAAPGPPCGFHQQRAEPLPPSGTQPGCFCYFPPSGGGVNATGPCHAPRNPGGERSMAQSSRGWAGVGSPAGWGGSHRGCCRCWGRGQRCCALVLKPPCVARRAAGGGSTHAGCAQRAPLGACACATPPAATPGSQL